MASKYFKRGKDKIKNNETGYTNKLWLSSLDAFLALAEPTAPFTTPGASKTITEDHTFTSPAGFFELLCAQDSVDGPAETAGEIGSKKPIYTVTGFLPGDGADIQEMVEELLNDNIIVLVKDATCPDGKVVQLGCDCKPARVDAAAFTSGTTATDGRKGWMLTIKSACRWWYEGTITLAT
jgi:hypothetical protein